MPHEPPSFFRSYLAITIGVCIAHAAMVWGMTFSPIKVVKKNISTPLVVRSVQLTPKLTLPSPSTMIVEAPIPVETVEIMIPVISEAPIVAVVEPLPVVISEPVPDLKPIEKAIEIKIEKPISKPIEKPQPVKIDPKPIEKKKEPPKKAVKVEPKPALTKPPKPKDPPVNKPAPKPNPPKSTPPNPQPKKEVKSPSVPVTPPKPPSPPKPSPEEIAAQEAAKARQKELLAQAEKSLAKIGEAREKGETGKGTIAKSSSLEQTALPKSIGSLEIEALPQLMQGEEGLTAREISYREEVASRLKMALKLPDYGEVKIKLTLGRSGKVESVQVMSSESVKNRQYVEKTLPSMTFLPFGNRFDGASQYTFVVMLKNQ